MQRRSTQGVVFVHACPKALCQHVEWALERVVGAPVSLSWAEQPVTHGSYRAEVAWTGAPGTGAKLVAALKQWPMLRFEVTEEASHGNDGERMSYVPGRGVHRSPVSANGDLVISEQQLRHLAATATSVEAFRHGVDALLGPDTRAGGCGTLLHLTARRRKAQRPDHGPLRPEAYGRDPRGRHDAQYGPPSSSG